MSRVKGAAWRAGRRAVDWSAARLKLATYVPHVEYREQLGLRHHRLPRSLVRRLGSYDTG